MSVGDGNLDKTDSNVKVPVFATDCITSIGPVREIGRSVVPAGGERRDRRGSLLSDASREPPDAGLTMRGSQRKFPHRRDIATHRKVDLTMRTLVLAAFAFSFSQETLRSETLYTSRTVTAVREGAGSYHGLIASVAENIAMTVLDRSGHWVKVQLPNKQVGWVAENSLKPAQRGQVVQAPQGSAWTTPRALAAALKGFGKSHVKGDPGSVDTLLAQADKGFTSDDLAAFQQAVRSQPSDNRGRVRIDDLDLPTPEYQAPLSEQQVGVSVGASIAGKGLVSAPDLRRYVNLICASVVEQSPAFDAEFAVFILNDATINAFAAPGGYVFVTLGLLRQCRDESELAGVIAHEVAHVYRRHGLQELTKRYPGVRAEEAFRELEEDLGEPSDEDREMDALANEAYERVVRPRLLEYEIEADRIGAVLAANAGYDPFGLVRVSERVARASEEHSGIFDAEYMRPDDAVKRARDIEAFVRKEFLPETPGARLGDRFKASTSAVR
jgi:hypothetical protein